jgi:hypothetical protein
MARRVSRVARTPDTGYKFECQGCEDEVCQTPQPELVFALTVKGKGKSMTIEKSEALQCCIDCAEEIKEENAEIAKALGLNHSQVRQVRTLDELDGVKQLIDKATAEGAVNTVTDAKLDKVLDMMEKLLMIQMNQMTASVVQVSAPRVVSSPATIAKPKRKILAPPKVKANATSKAKKPAAAKKAPTKRKPSRRR